jgi:hypothetical protein
MACARGVPIGMTGLHPQIGQRVRERSTIVAPAIASGMAASAVFPSRATRAMKNEPPSKHAPTTTPTPHVGVQTE